MARIPFMPLAVESYLADTDHLSDDEHGRYMLLLMRMWLAPGQRLPNDDKWLARRFRRSEDDIRSEFRPLIVEFFDNDGNWITQARLAKEHARASEKSRKQRERAKSRWQKEKDGSHGSTNTTDAAHAEHRDGKSEHGKSLENNDEAECRGNALTPTLTHNKKEESPPISPPSGEKKSKRKTSWPEGFSLTEKMRAYAEDKTPGVDADADFEKFMAHHQSKGSKFISWEKAWQTWCLSGYAKPMRATPNGANGHGKQSSPGRRGSALDDIVDAAAGQPPTSRGASGGTVVRDEAHERPGGESQGNLLRLDQAPDGPPNWPDDEGYWDSCSPGRLVAGDRRL